VNVEMVKIEKLKVEKIRITPIRVRGYGSLSVLRRRLWLPRLKVQENDCRFSCSSCVDENVAMDLLLLGIT